MFGVADMGVRLPAALYYDLDNTALEHGARLPSDDTVTALGHLARTGVETVAVTGRDIEDSRDALVALPGKFAIIAGGAVTTYIKRDETAGMAEIMPTPAAGLGFGYEVLDDIGAFMVVEKLFDWLDTQADEPDVIVRIPAFTRKAKLLEDARLRSKVELTHHHFTIADAVFVSRLSTPEAAQALAHQINDGGIEIPHRPLFAVAVTAQSGEPEVQITTKEANKKHAIQELARLGLPVFSGCTSSTDSLPDSVFVGDSRSDLPAFEAVGLSVAMADAPSEVKAAADYIIDSQQDGGFDDFVRRLAVF